MIAAQKLFEKEGYTNTSVEAIIKEAGIAKGTFYYYFKAKQDILGAIVENTVVQVKEYFTSIVNNQNLSSIDKLKEIFVGSKKQEKINPSVMEIVHLPENRELQEELNIQTIKIIAPLITKVFEQGFKEGIFKVKISVESIQLILAGSQFLLDSGLFEWSTQKRKVFLQEIQKILEQITGAKAGTLSFIVSHSK
ncbi:MAG: TetR/AcrR family transcriptional regulator [Proteobacteria bacterium]|nr:TetR/AcrR family transcriptional regulator [Pseudomonadota bacterium]